MGILTATLKALKFPLKLIIRLLRAKPKKSKNELREKQRKYIQNFDPTRLNNRSWQKSIGKDKKKRSKKNKKFIKSVNKNYETKQK